VKQDHKLIQHGPYRFIRHPAYAAFILMGLGISIGFSSLLGIIALFTVLLPALIYRIQVEEDLLGAEFGDLYKQYALHTRRLIPFLW
jgi:protein-S-isoprenylcysteine O-methyltransferase